MDEDVFDLVHDDVDPDEVLPCPDCGAEFDLPYYHGHGMRCTRFYRSDAAGA